MKKRIQSCVRALTIISSATLAVGCTQSQVKTTDHGLGPMKTIIGKFDEPKMEFIIVDITPSRTAIGERACWREVQEMSKAFISTAPRTSKLEIYATASRPGQPVLVHEYFASDTRRGFRESESRRLITSLEHFAKRKASWYPGSFVLEDSYRLAVRAGTLGQGANSTNKRLKCEVVVLSDLQQFSTNLKFSDIVTVRKNPQADIARLSKRVLSKMPRLTQRVTFKVVYFPGQAGGRALDPVEEERLKNFYKHIVREWGCGECAFSEPLFLNNPNP